MEHGRGELFAAWHPPVHWSWHESEIAQFMALPSLTPENKGLSALNLTALGALLRFLAHLCCSGRSAQPLLQSVLDALLESHKELGNPALHSSLKVRHAHSEQH